MSVGPLLGLVLQVDILLVGTWHATDGLLLATNFKEEAGIWLIVDSDSVTAW